MALKPEFQTGDIIEAGGETYQLVGQDHTYALIIPFPSENLDSERIEREQLVRDYRRIGSAPLPAPSPCAAGNGCPFNGRPVPVEFFSRDKLAG
ncbi:MAG TPA: hypothetical protein VFA95_13585 [Gammaproteobacteria bacterium]|nr:hypothetical protein [Gammaproteobacteria bacterium]